MGCSFERNSNFTVFGALCERNGYRQSNLKTSGLPIGPYDILLAGTAIAHDLVIVTSNLNEFKRISAVSIEN
jgi:tRNA(fMet)-specific endonuclease VapC